jgi:hypothetical protein
MILTLRRREDDRILREPKRMQLLANSDEGEEPPEAAKMKGVALPIVIHHRVAAMAANFCEGRSSLATTMNHHPVPGAD